MKFEHHDLEFERNGDCIILRQNESGGAEAVYLHVSQLRYVAEVAGVVQPSYPDDELTKRLARQLCEVRMEMAELYGCANHKLDILYERLDAYCESLPDGVFPFDLYQCPDPKTQQRATGSERPPFELQPSPKAE